MRQALNENRTVQLAVLGGLVLVVGIIFMLNMGGGGDAGEETAETTDPAESIVSPNDSTAPSGDSATSVPPPPPAGDVLAPTSTDTPIGPEPPPEVTAAYERGDTVVLLIVRKGGLEDAYVERSLKAIRGEPGVAVFVATTDEVAEYAHLTQGAGVSRAPALVVVSPRHVSGEVPVAQVHYGLKTPASVVQAVRDAAFTGEATTYSPG